MLPQKGKLSGGSSLAVIARTNALAQYGGGKFVARGLTCAGALFELRRPHPSDHRRGEDQAEQNSNDALPRFALFSHAGSVARRPC